MSYCSCGCKEETKGGLFLPGHDAKLRSRIEEKIGGLIKLSELVDKYASDDYSIPEDRFDNESFIAERLSNIPDSAKSSLGSALRYLYLLNGPTNILTRNKFKEALPYLEPAELIIFRWLYTRTNGNLRSTYGKAALISARNCHYRCERCGFSDVRALNLDHIDGRVEGTKFACLCANCHTIKSREKDWTGNIRYDKTKTLLGVDDRVDIKVTDNNATSPSANPSGESNNCRGDFPMIYKIELWAKNPKQYNSKIIRAYLNLERNGSVQLDVMRRFCSNQNNDDFYVPTFRSNYAQMKQNGGHANGKVFYDENGVVYMCERVREEVRLWFERNETR